MKGILSGRKVNFILQVDSKGMSDTITTLQNGREYRLLQIVQRIRDSFASGDTDVVRWAHTRASSADALTKWSPKIEKDDQRHHLHRAMDITRT